MGTVTTETEEKLWCLKCCGKSFIIQPFFISFLFIPRFLDMKRYLRDHLDHGPSKLKLGNWKIVSQ